MLRKLHGSEMGRLEPDAFRESQKHPIYVMFQNIRSMWNVGSIFRTCDAARIQKVIITGYTATPPRPQIDKVALGATETVDWEYVADPLEALADLKDQGVKIAALEITENARNYDELSAEDFPLCLVLGNEVTGIDDEVLQECDFALEIPQYGTKHSLNVAVSAGIAIFEAVRQFRACDI
ncbi:tRNA/rRNA methyltransferase (SpoU) [Chloroherpeton thalassium ATCC 35110]|uniref:tRNA/rRNA methyltransferase (SpoU) n=1 Tax=Chloroherpeton thalassium (strain ATCC 35110 / GB-78) TaxID=517418 RepID=B3QSY7_CHLT3|nr:RNA methyltransferase [Chloroherpeton thalassium]ACF12630.1 tRNA/rRNA methyltransferase (SpoU) [Chloroherpeton thalassium ATCC 35110]